MVGGSDRMYFSLTKLLEAKGHNVIPFAAKDSRNFPTAWDRYFPVSANFNTPRTVDLIRYTYSFPAKHALELLLKDYAIDVAHLHIYYGRITSSILSVLRENVPIVQTLHDYKLICPVYSLVSNGQICEACQGINFWRALPRFCNRNSLARTSLSVVKSYVSHWLGNIDKVDRFIAVSDFLRDKMIQYGLPPDKISTLYNMVDTSDLPKSTISGDYMLYFGRIERIKGVFTLLEAVAPLSVPSILWEMGRRSMN